MSGLGLTRTERAVLRQAIAAEVYGGNYVRCLGCGQFSVMLRSIRNRAGFTVQCGMRCTNCGNRALTPRSAA